MAFSAIACAHLPFCLLDIFSVYIYAYCFRKKLCGWFGCCFGNRLIVVATWSRRLEHIFSFQYKYIPLYHIGNTYLYVIFENGSNLPCRIICSWQRRHCIEYLHLHFVRCHLQKFVASKSFVYQSLNVAFFWELERYEKKVLRLGKKIFISMIRQVSFCFSFPVFKLRLFLGIEKS